MCCLVCLLNTYIYIYRFVVLCLCGCVLLYFCVACGVACLRCVCIVRVCVLFSCVRRCCVVCVSFFNVFEVLFERCCYVRVFCCCLCVVVFVCVVC